MKLIIKLKNMNKEWNNVENFNIKPNGDLLNINITYKYGRLTSKEYLVYNKNDIVKIYEVNE